MRAINSAPRFAVSRALPFIQATYISESIVARNSPGTRNSLLMFWRFLRPLRRYFPILQNRFWFWHDIQLARECNHLVGSLCVKEDLGKRCAFVSRTSTHACARKISCHRNFQLTTLSDFSIEWYFNDHILYTHLSTVVGIPLSSDNQWKPCFFSLSLTIISYRHRQLLIEVYRIWTLYS